MAKESPLGQKTVYVETYSPELLFPVPRRLARDKTGIPANPPFQGLDYWTGYELSWLNLKGKPEIAMGEFTFSCHTPNVVESKSFKLYLNSLNQTPFKSILEVEKTIKKDLSEAVGGEAHIKLFPHSHHKDCLSEFNGFCLDTLDIETQSYNPDPSFLKTGSKKAQETLYSNLLKSNCLATGQPDWGSVQINYAGPEIDREGLLKYFISLRRHSGFAEHLVEQIYFDILEKCRPEKLSVYGRYTRRGGLDINPFRSNFEKAPQNHRQIRQ